jgi:hypothetical protein
MCGNAPRLQNGGDYGAFFYPRATKHEAREEDRKPHQPQWSVADVMPCNFYFSPS